MREIKFRAWFAENKKMYSWEELINNIGLSESIFIETELWKPMQFTGLLDKNGREIYEGDIGKTKNEEVFIVVFDNGAFRLQDIPTELWFCVCNSYNITELGIEVIGDIHENPELLEKEK